MKGITLVSGGKVIYDDEIIPKRKWSEESPIELSSQSNIKYATPASN